MLSYSMQKRRRQNQEGGDSPGRAGAIPGSSKLEVQALVSVYPMISR